MTTLHDRAKVLPINPRFVVGVAGSMQSGKQELEPTWKGLGWTFVDLNPFADRARVEHRARYEALGLGDGLGENGKENGKFYAKILAEPHLHRATMEIEVPFVAAALTVHLATLRPIGPPIVLSWGYIHQLFHHGIKPDYMVLCRADHDTWVRRIQRRANEMGWTGMDEAQVVSIAKLLELDPDEVRDAIVTAYPNDHYVLDTSPDDWGSSALLDLIDSVWG